MTMKLDIKTEKSKPEPIKQFIQLIYESDDVLSVYRFTLNNNLYEVEKYRDGDGWIWNGTTVTIEEANKAIKWGDCYAEIKKYENK